MSALNFQKMMAHLIRFPDESFDAIQARLNFPELTVQERKQLSKMETDPLVRKFGEKMRFLRQRDAARVMRLSKDFMDEATFNNLYLNHFEASRPSLDLNTLGLQFVEFCTKDPAARELLQKTEPYLEDVLRYEYVRTFIEIESIVEGDPKLPKNSYLRHNAFAIVDFQYDIPAIDKLKLKDPDSVHIPQKKPMKLIFLAVEQYPYCRVFQIDESVEAFLNAQRTDPESWTNDLPPAYAPMVKVGLCRPLPN